MFRLTRISKLYKIISKLKEKGITSHKENKNENNMPKSIDDSEEKVASKFYELILRRVIGLILLMIIGIIFFDPSFYSKPSSSMKFGMKIFNIFDSYDSPILNNTFNIYVKENMVIFLKLISYLSLNLNILMKNSSIPLVYLSIANLSYGNWDKINTLRVDEKIEVFEDCLDHKNINYGGCYGCFDNRRNTQIEAALGLLKTLLTFILLSGASILFNKDINRLVITPIESMVKKINKISINPIQAMEDNEKEEYVKNIINSTEISDKCCFSNTKQEENLETTILDKTISKIGALLAIGFGEAGSKIISKILKQNSKDVNPVIDGEKIIAIYGFCDIRNFTDSTEILQEDVMIFVNEIAEIVHEITISHLGTPNKNIGDAFLLVWKIENNLVKKNEFGEITLIKCDSVFQMVDTAIVAMIKILIKIYKSFKLNKVYFYK